MATSAVVHCSRTVESASASSQLWVDRLSGESHRLVTELDANGHFTVAILSPRGEESTRVQIHEGYLWTDGIPEISTEEAIERG